MLATLIAVVGVAQTCAAAVQHCLACACDSLDCAGGVGAAAGAFGAGAAAAGSAFGGGQSGRGGGGSSYGDRGFTYYLPSGLFGGMRQDPSFTSPETGRPPVGSRLMYDDTTTVDGQRWYHTNPPGMRGGWIPESQTAPTRPTVPPPAPPPSGGGNSLNNPPPQPWQLEGGSGLAHSSSAQTSGARG